MDFWTVFNCDTLTLYQTGANGFGDDMADGLLSELSAVNSSTNSNDVPGISSRINMLNADENSADSQSSECSSPVDSCTSESPVQSVVSLSPTTSDDDSRSSQGPQSPSEYTMPIVPGPIIQTLSSFEEPSRVDSLAKSTGACDFRVDFSDPPKHTMDAAWIFSKRLYKLFVRRDHPCPVHFSVSNLSAEQATNLQVRAQVVLLEAGQSPQPVRRCANHLEPSSTHFICCDSADFYDEQSQSVVVSLGQSGRLTAIYKFMCLNTCPSKKRRILQLNFTLETKSGQEMGRQVMKLCVCARPGRDSQMQEETPDRSAKNAGGIGGSKKPREASDDDVEAKRARPSSSESSDQGPVDEVFLIRVHGQKRRDFVEQMLQLYDSMEGQRH